MKHWEKLTAIIACLLFPVLNINAETPLTTCQYKGISYTSTGKGQKLQMTGDITADYGFTLGKAGGYLIAPDKTGKVTFTLNGRYSRLTFLMGPMTNTIELSSVPSVITVRADGKKLLDERFYDFDIPRPYEIDVAGAEEVTFDIVSGEGYIGVGEPVLWTKDETAVMPDTGNLPPESEIMLVSGLRPYYSDGRVIPVSPSDKVRSMKINGKEYTDGLVLNMRMQISGGHFGSAMFNLKSRFSKLSFIIGPLDNERNTAEGRGYVTIQGDGRTLFQKDLGQLDMAEQVILDVKGVDRLSFHSEQSQWDINAAFADITAWPEGMSPEGAVPDGSGIPADADPRLADLPDVCPLMSNIEPFAILGGLSRDKMLYTGESDYINFSMGGVRHSEGMIFASGANFFHDHIYSSASFDLGKQFDYITFITGSVGPANVKDGEINVWADDKLLYSIPVSATSMPEKHWVKIDRCRKLTFDNRKGGGMTGVADIVLYRGEIVDNGLFPHTSPDAPENIGLLQFARPYLHYIYGMEAACYDGSDIRRYWTLRDGTRINNGFMLRTSIHFSLEHGALGDDPNAAAAGVAGSIAVGSSFVAGGMVGGVMTGSTLAGMAGLMLLAAGGEAEESSCAAFNTYGEYNSVTFTVACISPADAGLLEAGTFTDRQQRLLIGADGAVMAELMLNETDAPVTFTVPINGCRQLMFWMPCDNGSGQYIIYDARLSKSASELVRPASSVISQAHVSIFDWTDAAAPEIWEKPQQAGTGEINKYIGGIQQLYNGTKALIHNNAGQPRHEFHTWYLKAADGQVCKATRIINNGGHDAVRDATGYQAALGANFDPYEERIPQLAKDIAAEIETLQKLRSQAEALHVQHARAILDLPSLGLNAIRYGKELKKCKNTADQCNDVIDTYLKNKQEHLASIIWLLEHSIDIDGSRSTEYTVFTPLAPGESPGSDTDLQLVETFKTEAVLK